ncbi:MAG TPA: nicotinate phosphoribosyltransferase [Thermodesulfobacteriota bacterium]|nr:nicotinate phosphoribosyltransferase [Thermodesulfobacteriota bacterium]
MEPTDKLVSPMLTDFYQITMSYAYWKAGVHEEEAVFDLFFRTNPFRGEFGIYAGLEEKLRLFENFHFSDDHIAYLMEQMPQCERGFFDWLKNVDCSKMKIYALKEGTISFPREPLMRVQGPIAVGQLLETPVLTLTNYPSLMTTNAAKYRLAVGFNKGLIEFGLRRAQGPDGGVSASRYSYMGGFDGTSDVLAGYLFGVPIKGTHAHSYVQSFSGIEDLKNHTLAGADGKDHDFVKRVLETRAALGFNYTNQGELASFIAYAQAFPKEFLALVDTYDTLKSGVPNFICVAIELLKLGHKPIGVRLDSGDLSYLSKTTRKMFMDIGAKTHSDLAKCMILASNEINKSVLISLKQQGHEIDTFGIGTHLVTCDDQPSMGCVYKLVEAKGIPRIKLTQELNKMTIPGRKEVYRLCGEDGFSLLDLMVKVGDKPPEPKKRVLCHHPFDHIKRVYVTPSEVIPLHHCVWDGKRVYPEIPLSESRNYVLDQLRSTREDHLRDINPTPYKVSVSEQLYSYVYHLWTEESPVTELK